MRAAIVEERTLMVQGNAARVFTGGNADQAILLIHGGWGGAAMHWSRVWDTFAHRFRVVAPDLPGIGDVTKPGFAQVSGYVRWLEALLDGLGVRSVFCVGNSFGASLAWSFAGRSPDRCQGVVLVNGVPMPATPAPLLWLGRRAIGRRVMRAALQRVSYTPRRLPLAFADPGLAPPELGTSLAETPPRRLETFLDCVIAGDGPPAPRAPVLVLFGEADRLPGTRRGAGAMVRDSIRGARLVSMPNAGHFPQLERPDRFVSAVEEFIDSVRAMRPRAAS